MNPLSRSRNDMDSGFDPAAVLITQRLHLRPLLREEADHAFLSRLYRRRENMAFISPTPLTDADIDERIGRMQAHWDSYGYGMWLVLERGSQAPIGYCGLRHHPDLEPLEIGYFIDHPHWRKGIACEAAGAIIEFAREVLQVSCLAAVTAPGHAASRRVLEKLGFHRQADVVYNQERSWYFLQYRVKAT